MKQAPEAFATARASMLAPGVREGGGEREGGREGGLEAGYEVEKLSSDINCL